MHKVAVFFDRPAALYIELNDEQYAAAQDEYSWEDLFELMQDEITEHLFATTGIEDVRDV
jgi:hypothetical protein